MGSQAVRLNDELIDRVRDEAAAMSRSMAGQVEHWLRLGRAVERAGSFDYRRVRRALAGELNSEDLTPEEAEIWWEHFEDAMHHPGPEEEAFFRAMRERHRAAGVDTAALGD